MRFAKLEVKVIITLFLMQYDYELVDKAGKAVTKLPEPDRTNLYVDNYIYPYRTFFLTRKRMRTRYQTPPVERVCTYFLVYILHSRRLISLLVVKYKRVD